jgi:hypothetical protein
VTGDSDLRRKITSDWALKFKRICELTPTYMACVRNQFCFSGNATEFCPICAERFELIRPLRLHFDIYPWLDFPDDFEAPSNLNPAETTRWWAEALEEALRECGAGAA